MQPELKKKVLWTNETKNSLYQSDDKSKVRRKEAAVQDPKHYTLSRKHGGGVMAWACTAATGTG